MTKLLGGTLRSIHHAGSRASQKPDDYVELTVLDVLFERRRTLEREAERQKGYDDRNKNMIMPATWAARQISWHKNFLSIEGRLFFLVSDYALKFWQWLFHALRDQSEEVSGARSMVRISKDFSGKGRVRWFLAIRVARVLLGNQNTF